MGGVYVSSFINPLVPSFALNQKKEGEQSSTNWKVYAAAGTAIALSALAANWAFSGASNSNSDNDIQDLVQQVYSTTVSKNLKPELKETAKKVLDVIEKVFAEKGVTDHLLVAVSTFASEIDFMSNRFPGVSPEGIALLSASEGIWRTTIEVDPANEIIKSIFDNSCKEWNFDCDDLIKTLTARFNDPNLDKSVREYVDASRNPCEYPFCENWTPKEEVKQVRSDSILSKSKSISREELFDSFATKKGLSEDYRNAGRAVLSHFNKLLDTSEEEEEWAFSLASWVAYEIAQYKTHFPDASPNQIAVLAVLDSFLTRLNVFEDTRDSVISHFMEENCKNSDIFEGTDKGFSTLFNSASQEANEYLASWKDYVSNATLFCENLD